MSAVWFQARLIDRVSGAQHTAAGFYIGKPEPTIMEKALKKMGLPKEAVAMVGDNYNTDIKAGLNAGIDTILVYTGVSTRDYVSKQVHQPTHQIDALTDWEV